MNVLRFVLAFTGVALTLVGSLLGIQTDQLSVAVFSALVGLSLKSLSRIAFLFVTLSASGTAFALFVDGKSIDFAAGTFLFAFLLVSGSLRVAAANEPAIVSLGERLGRIAPNRQFVLVSLATGLFALALLNGALNFVSGIFAAKTSAPLADRLRLTRTFISGFALNPVLSPIAIPFVVISSVLPSISWGSMLPYLAVCAAILWLSGRVQNSFVPNADEHGSASEDQSGFDVSQGHVGGLPTAIALILAPILATLALVALAGLKPSHAALTSIFLASLFWPAFRLKKPGLILNGYTVAINEAAILGSTLILGALLLEYFPLEWEQAVAGLLFTVGPFAPAAIIVFFVCGGLIGLQPAICFLLAYAAVFPFVSTLGTTGAPVYAALIVGWALNSLVSPVGLPVLVVSRAFNISPVEFALTYGWIYLVLTTLLTSLVLSISML